MKFRWNKWVNIEFLHEFEHCFLFEILFKLKTNIMFLKTRYTKL